MAMKRCPVCGERFSDTYKNCPFCEEEEYWEEEQETRRPILREGSRGSSRRSPYGIVTPVLIVLIVLMAALLVYLLYGDKLKPSGKDPTGDKPGIQEPQKPQKPVVPGNTPAQPDDTTEPDDHPEGDASGNTNPTTPPEGNVPDDGVMPEGNGSSGGSGSSGTSGSGNSGGSSGGMSYATAAALPSGLTLNLTDFTESVSKGTVKLRVSGGSGTYTWISEDPSIATVASDGTVTLVAKGTTHVVVTDGSKRGICIVRVTGGSAPASGGSSGNSGTSSGSETPSGSGTSSGGETPSGGSLRPGNAVVINGGNGVRVRSGPGTDHEILATIPNGGSVRVVSSAGNDWYEITFTAVGGVTTTGYMKGEFLSNG